MLAGAVAISGGGTTQAGAVFAGAGVYTENKVNTLVKAYIDGDGANTTTDGITAASVSLSADDSSVVNAIAGAASVAASFGGTAGVSVAIGLALAFNEVSNDVSAYIANADEGVLTTGSGNVDISAASQGSHLFEITLGGALTANALVVQTEADLDDEDISGNQATLI